jgi:hypothetical protein
MSLSKHVVLQRASCSPDSAFTYSPRPATSSEARGFPVPKGINPTVKTKMKIKINDKNIAALQAAVEQSNGSATAHTFRSWHSLLECARQAEAQLQRLGLAKGSRSGAIATANSGGSVANGYKYARITSTAKMVRGSSAWFLTSLTCSETFRRTAGDTFVSLTNAQDAEVTAKFCAQYGKQPVTAAKTEVAS